MGDASLGISHRAHILYSPLKSLFFSDPNLTLKAPDFYATPISANIVKQRPRGPQQHPRFERSESGVKQVKS